MDDWIKGVKTSEFWVVLVVLVPWVCQQFGIDFNSLMASANEIRQQVQVIDDTSDLPVWVAMAFVVGRKILKWKAMP